MFGARSTCTVGRPAAARGALLPAAATHVNAKATKRMQKRRPKKVRPARPRPRPRAPGRRLGEAAGGSNRRDGRSPRLAPAGAWGAAHRPMPPRSQPRRPPPSAPPSRAAAARLLRMTPTTTATV